MPNNSKSYNINTLCNLRGISLDSDEANDMKNWTVLQLLNAIKAERDNRKAPPPPEPETEEDDDISISRRIGCEH